MRTQRFVLGSGEPVLVDDKVRSIDDDVFRDGLLRIESGGRDFIQQQVEFSNVIGVNICVPTTDADVIAFGRRGRAPALSRFVFGREPAPCQSLVVLLRERKNEPGVYFLIAVFVGTHSVAEPWDRYILRNGDQALLAASQSYWSACARVVHPAWPISCHLCARTTRDPLPLHQGVVCPRCMGDIERRYGAQPRSEYVDVEGWGTLQLPVR